MWVNVGPPATILHGHALSTMLAIIWNSQRSLVILNRDLSQTESLCWIWRFLYRGAPGRSQLVGCRPNPATERKQGRSTVVKIWTWTFFGLVKNCHACVGGSFCMQNLWQTTPCFTVRFKRQHLLSGELFFSGNKQGRLSWEQYGWPRARAWLCHVPAANRKSRKRFPRCSPISRTAVLLQSWPRWRVDWTQACTFCFHSRSPHGMSPRFVRGPGMFGSTQSWQRRSPPWVTWSPGSVKGEFCWAAVWEAIRATTMKTENSLASISCRWWRDDQAPCAQSGGILHSPSTSTSSR